MTVAELIACLQKQDPDRQVWLACSAGELVILSIYPDDIDNVLWIDIEVDVPELSDD